jgi:hypothetical protein
VLENCARRGGRNQALPFRYRMFDREDDSESDSSIPNPSTTESSKQGKYRTVHILADFDTFRSRLGSLREWPYATLSPWRVAIAGFYHEATEKDPATVICFSCGALWRCDGTYGRYSDHEVQIALCNYHENGCLWADMWENTLHIFVANLADQDREETTQDQEEQYNTTSDKEASRDFSVHISRARKSDPTEELLILEAMTMLLSKNCVFSFSYRK